MNSRPLHSYPRYFQDWLLSETRSRLNLAERGLFGDLCDLMATDGGSLDDSECAIQRRCACSSREFKKAWPKVRECFEVRDGRLYNPKLTYALEQASKSFDARSKGGKATAELRWGTKESDSSASSSAIAGEIAERLPSSSPSSTITNTEHPLPPQGGLIFGEKPERKTPVSKTSREEFPESEDFKAFYTAYWRHVGRGPAWSAYRTHVHNGDASKVMAAMLEERPVMLDREEDKRPHPATWLNQRRWRDREGLAEVKETSPYHRGSILDDLIPAQFKAKALGK